jgi:hypothetical protein
MLVAWPEEKLGCITDMTSVVRVLRTVFGVLPIVAIGRQFVIHVGLGFNVLNFFSYFTNISNLFAAAVLLMATYSVNGRGTVLARLTAVVAMTIVGVVFSVLLRGTDLGDLKPWVNFVVHYLMPCIILLDWLLYPPTVRLGIRELAVCLTLPAIYVFYTLVRGMQTGWYPYAFLNPASVGGYGGVAVYVAGITVLFVLAGWLLIAVANRRHAAEG